MPRNKTIINNKATIVAAPSAGFVIIKLEDGRNFVVSTSLAESLGRGLLDLSQISEDPVAVPNWPGQNERVQ